MTSHRGAETISPSEASVASITRFKAYCSTRNARPGHSGPGREYLTTVAVRPRSRLPAVTEHRDRLARERLAHEVRNDHAVLRRLPRTDGVEEADDDDGDAALLVIREAQELIDRLRAGVAPAALRRGAEDEVAVL